MWIAAQQWWERHHRCLLVSLGGLWVAAWLRQTQGIALVESYRLWQTFWQGVPQREEVITDARMRELQYRITEMENENRQLKRLLERQPTMSREGIWGAVIGRGADAWWQVILVDRGQQHGVKPGFVAVGPGGLVGRVTEVFPNTSRVLLISDPGSQVGAIVSRSRYPGMLRGREQNTAVLSFFARDPDVRPGDIVATSPYSSLFPQGIPIGVVRSVDLDRQPAPEAIVDLAVPLHLLEYVQLQPFSPLTTPKAP
ncbi:MAG: rod shape-determining protein MreC [Pseudanabaenaceae cyanobacterium]